MPDEPRPVDRDSRGILSPWLLRQRVTLTRYPPPAGLDGLVHQMWAVRWDRRDAGPHVQDVLTHPAANLSVGAPDGGTEDDPAEARLTGVQREVARRTLVGRSWTVAAMTTPGGLGALVDVPVETFTDRVVALGSALAVDEDRLVRAVEAEAEEVRRVEVLGDALAAAVRPERVDDAREVAAIVALVRADPEVRRLADLVAAAGVGERTLQRLFAEHVGVSPTWVLRRYRLQEAAEAVRDGQEVVWADVASRLGYADQAHLVRDFRAAVGTTPAAYARAAARG